MKGEKHEGKHGNKVIKKGPENLGRVRKPGTKTGKKPTRKAGQDKEFTRQPKGTTFERKSEMEHDAPHNIHPTAEQEGTPGNVLLTNH